MHKNMQPVRHLISPFFIGNRERYSHLQVINGLLMESVTMGNNGVKMTVIIDWAYTSYRDKDDLFTSLSASLSACLFVVFLSAPYFLLLQQLKPSLGLYISILAAHPLLTL